VGAQRINGLVRGLREVQPSVDIVLVETSNDARESALDAGSIDVVFGSGLRASKRRGRLVVYEDQLRLVRLWTGLRPVEIELDEAARLRLLLTADLCGLATGTRALFATAGVAFGTSRKAEFAARRGSGRWPRSTAAESRPSMPVVAYEAGWVTDGLARRARFEASGKPSSRPPMNQPGFSRPTPDRDRPGPSPTAPRCPRPRASDGRWFRGGPRWSVRHRARPWDAPLRDRNDLQRVAEGATMGGRPIVPNPGALHPWILALPENGGWIRPIIRAFAGMAVAVACIMGWTSTSDAGAASPSTPITVSDAIGTVKHDVEMTAFGLEARTARGPVDNFRWHTGQTRSAFRYAHGDLEVQKDIPSEG
jgi:hypothetical protein